MEKRMDNFLIKTILAIVASATVTGMLSKETLPQKIKNFVAGVCGGAVVVITCSETHISNLLVLIMSNIMTSFVTILWPMIGDIAAKYLKRKTDAMV